MSDPRDVIVVGAGPAGCATAILLRQRGRDVLLLDEARFPREKVCGESLSPEVGRFLGAAGLESLVRVLHPHPLRGMTLVAPDGISFQGDYHEGCGMAVRRRDFDHALLEGARAAGVEIEEGTRVTDLVRTGDRVHGVLVDRAGSVGTRNARLVIGADGRRSVVARKLGLLGLHPRFRKFAVRGHWDGVEGLTERGEMHVGGGGYCGIAPLSRTHANVAFVLDHREMAAAAGDLEGFYRAALRDRWPRISERLARATMMESPRAIGPLALVARRVSAPGVLLVGDAAGFYDPFTGEGVALAFRCAEAACEVGDRALAGGAVSGLADYGPLHRAATQSKFQFNRMLQIIVGKPRLSNFIAHRLADRPDLADQLIAVAGNLTPARAVLGPRFLLRLLLG